MAVCARNEVTDEIHGKRKVVVVGKTGCGKSTIANTIMNSNNFEVRSTFKSVTSEAAPSSAMLTFNEENYQVLIIDTVGLFDTTGKSNEEIVQNIKKTVQINASDGLNLVLFVLKQGRLTQEENTTFEYVMKEFGECIKPVSALVITNCDLKGEKARKNLIEEFKTRRDTKKIASFMTHGIFAVGFPNIDEADDEEKPILEKKIKKDQLSLQKLVADAHEPHLKNEIKQEHWWMKMYHKHCVIV